MFQNRYNDLYHSSLFKIKFIMENIFCRKSAKKKSFKNLFTYGQSPIGFGYAIITEIYEVYL